MVVAVLEDVLRRDGEKSAEHERPEHAALRLEQQRQAESTDVGTLQVHDLAAREPGEQRLGRHAGEQRHGEAIVPSDHVVAELRHHQDERDEERDQIARVDVPQVPPPAPDSRLRNGRVNHPGHGFGSVIV